MGNELGYIAIYARQSIFNADSKSIEDQIKICQDKIADGSPMKIYKDAGYTGANTDRPDFQKLLTDLKAGLLKTVFVWKLDRISRSVADFAQMLELFDKYDVEFCSATEPGLNKTMLQMVSIFAQMERENIQMRVKENYYSRLEVGMLGGGAAPFGYERAIHHINGKKCYMYVVDEEKAKISKYLFEEYGNTDRSLGSLTGWLNSEGIKTNRGHYWTSTALATLFKNPAFVRADATIYTYLQSLGVKLNNNVEMFQGENGLYLYGSRKIPKSDKKRFKYQDYNGDYATLAPHDGIIDSDLWLRVQTKLQGNVRIGSSGTSGVSWLSGFTKCGYCGKASVFKRTNGIAYVSCIGRQVKHCYEQKRTIRAADVEAQVEKALLKFLRELPEKQERESKKFIPEINKINIEIAKIDESINNYIDKLEEATGATFKRINDKVNDLDAKRQLLQRELIRFDVDSKKPVFGGFDINDIVANWDSFDLEQKKAVGKVFIKKVSITDDKLDIKMNGGGSAN